MKICWIVAQFLTHKPVNFASLMDSFIIDHVKNHWYLDLKCKPANKNSFPAPKGDRDIRETVPRPVRTRVLRTRTLYKCFLTAHLNDDLLGRNKFKNFHSQLHVYLRDSRTLAIGAQEKILVCNFVTKANSLRSLILTTIAGVCCHLTTGEAAPL